MDIPDFLTQKVLQLVKGVPRGKVVSYGQVAAQLGIKDARVIGWTLHSLGGERDFPWWRVLNNEGKITIKAEADRVQQRELLMAEGVQVNDDFSLDIEKYRHGTVPGQKRLL